MLGNIVRTATALVLPAAALAGAPQDRCDLVGIHWGVPTTTLWDVDPLTGVATNPRSDSYPDQATALTRAPNGDLYGLAVSTGTLYTIDLVTAAVTEIGPLGLPFAEGDLDFHPTTGVLYGVNSSDPGTSARQLFTVNTATGAGTVVGDVILVGDLSAMAFDAAGTLWVLDTSNEELYTVDTGTGAILTSVGLSSWIGQIAGMDFDPTTGTLYVANGGFQPFELHTLNTTTGALSLVGSTGMGASTGGLAGLEFVCPLAANVPALGGSGLALLLVALAAAGVLLVRRSA